MVELLLAHGAEVDRPSHHYGGAMGFAAHYQRTELAQRLAPLSRDVHNLVFLGMQQRLAELFAEDPSLVNLVHPRSGLTPLFALPPDEALASEMAAFLLAKGADPQRRDRHGNTAAQAAARRGLLDVADLLED